MKALKKPKNSGTNCSASNFSTDPYGKLEWCIGSDDDFWCFDFAVVGDQVKLHAVINSETGSFIQDAFPPRICQKNEAVVWAQAMVDEAIDWCCENQVDFQPADAQKFVKAVEKEVNPT